MKIGGANQFLPAIGSKWKHRTRGTVYTVVEIATLQASGNPLDGAGVVVYVGEGGRTWVRPTGEFTDGRFVEMRRVIDVESASATTTKETS